MRWYGHKLLVAFSCVISLVVVIGISVLYVQRGLDLPISSPATDHAADHATFNWYRYLPKRPSSSERTDWDRVVTRGAFTTFERLRQEIVSNRITADAGSAFEVIITDTMRRARINRALKSLESGARVEGLRALYKELMLAPSHPEALLQRLSAIRSTQFRHVRRHATDSGRYLAWGLSNTIYAALIAYESTGDRRFLEYAAETLKEILRYRDTETGRVDRVTGRVMAGWGGTHLDGEGRYSTNITLTGRICFALVWFAHIVQSDPALAPEYARTGMAFITAARQSLADYKSEYHVLDNREEGYYVRATDGDVEPINHMAGAANALLLLDRLTDGKNHRRMALQLATYFRRSMRMDRHGCLVWGYWPRPGQRDSPERERIWKAGVTILHPIFAHRMQVVFTDQDMKDIACTFLNNVVRSNGSFNMYIDEPFAELREPHHSKGGKGTAYLRLTPMILLDQYEPRIRRVIEDVIASRPDAGGWLAAPYSLIAYAHRFRAQKSGVDFGRSPPSCARL